MTLVEDTGTREREWAAWRPLRDIPELLLEECPSALIVAPHPDDEILATGGTLARLRAAAVDVSLVAVTDGEASHPQAPVGKRVLGKRRAAETERALQLLVGRTRIARLRLPDGALARCETHIEREVGRRLTQGMWCFAPFVRDGHPDHEACARATARACAEHGAHLIEYPIWMWHWTQPGAPGVPWERARRVSLSQETRARKMRAICAFESQIAPIGAVPEGGPILPPQVLEHFHRAFEVVFV